MARIKTKILRIVRWSIIIAILSITGMALYLFLPVLPDPSVDFLPRKGNITNIAVTKTWQEQNSRLSEITLTSDNGIYSKLAIRVPKQISTPLPVAVLLGGHRTGRDAVHLVPEVPNVITVALSYPYREQAAGFMGKLAELQQAILDTAPSILLALDYLFKQAYVDKHRVELVGVSLGAFFVTPPAVLDERVKRVWLIHGAGNPGDILTHQAKDRFRLPSVRWVVGHSLAALIHSHHLTPEQWTYQMSPRPVMVINARGDKAFPQTSIDTLHLSLQQPFEIMWTDGMHVTPGRREVISQLTKLVFSRIATGK